MSNEEALWEPSTEQQWMWQLAWDLLETHDYWQECAVEEKAEAANHWRQALETAQGAIDTTGLSSEHSNYILALIMELQNDMPDDTSSYID
jgi:hypothetical protein